MVASSASSRDLVAIATSSDYFVRRPRNFIKGSFKKDEGVKWVRKK